ncbi:MAG TPA: N-acyl homoserine lactonase family protein [Allosphingosinicella sp.]|nr:N-acyl homoserine lactonase family protein [Allosphingosinicella sp.]
MTKRILTLALGWLALVAMQAPAPAPRPAMALWRLDCGDFQINDINAFMSDTSEYPARPKHLVGSCYLIKHGNDYLLWDTGMPAALVSHPDVNPVMTVTLRTRIVDQLARIGVRPEQITMVGISHYHGDHTGQARDFPNARLLMGAGDLAVLRGRSAEAQADLARWLTGGGAVTEVQGDLDIFHDGGVVMLNLPGHTPGHHGLLVRLASGPVLLSGDTYHFTEQVAHRGVPPFNTDRAQSLASMDRFDRLGRNLHARIIIQHEPADVARLPAFPAAAR